MTIWEAALLGLAQGLTEFLPISSTAHLRILPALQGKPDAGAAFTAVLQLGTLAAVVVFFWRDLLAMLRAALGSATRTSRDAHMLLYLVAGTVPIGIAGVLFKDAIHGPLRSLRVIALSLITVGVLMAVVERLARHDRDMASITLKDALFIGAGQMLALIPGVSRSGITLVAALALGLSRETAARFSFLLSIPAVAAAGVFELPDVLRARDLTGGAVVVGLLVAGVSGYLSIAWLLRFLRTRTTLPFVAYRIALGAALFAALAAGWL